MVGNLVNDFFFGPQLGTTSKGVPIHQLNLERWLRPLTPDEYASISTLARYEARGVPVADTVACGALRWHSSEPARWRCERETSQRYWAHRIR